MRTRRGPAQNAWAPSLLLLALAAGLGCRTAAGSSCDPGEARCLDPERELVCEAGKFIETPCRGKGGCTTLKQSTSCDISGNRPGDPCSRDEEGVAACSDAKRMIACRSGRFELVPCKGPQGCETIGAQSRCDQSVADQGDACKEPDAKSCSSDQAQVLVCKDERLAPLFACRGPAGCSSAAGKLACDQTIADRDDGCDAALEGHVACSQDRAALLVCRSGRFQPSETCRGNKKCAVSGQSTRCAAP